MQFGTLGMAGGQNRLNVAVTRARVRMEIFSSITGADFRLTPQSPKGVALLAAFLDYAKAGIDYQDDKPQAMKSIGRSLSSVVAQNTTAWRRGLLYADLTHKSLSPNPATAPHTLLFLDDAPLQRAASAREHWVWRPGFARTKGWRTAFYTTRAHWRGVPYPLVVTLD